MPGPLLAEAYSQARLDLDSLDKDIKKAKKVLEKAAKSFEKSLKLELQLNTTEANRGLKEFKKQVDLVKSQIEKDAVTIQVKTDADISDARAAGADAARAVEAGFGEPDTTVTVETVSAGGDALDPFRDRNGQVNVRLQPEYILDDDDPFAAQASLIAQALEQSRDLTDLTVTEDVTVKLNPELDTAALAVDTTAVLAEAEAELKAGLTDLTEDVGVDVNAEPDLDTTKFSGKLKAKLKAALLKVGVEITRETFDVGVDVGVDVGDAGQATGLAQLQEDVERTLDIREKSYKEQKRQIQAQYNYERSLTRNFLQEDLTVNDAQQKERQKRLARAQAQERKLLAKFRKQSKDERLLDGQEEIRDAEGKIIQKRKLSIKEQLENASTLRKALEAERKEEIRSRQISAKEGRAFNKAERKRAAKERKESLTTVIEVKYKDSVISGGETVRAQARQIREDLGDIPKFVTTEVGLDGVEEIRKEVLNTRRQLESLSEEQRIALGLTGDNDVLRKLDFVDEALDNFEKNRVLELEADGTLTVLGQVKEITEALDSIPESERIKFKTDGVAESITEAEGLDKAIDGVTDDKTTTFKLDGIASSLGKITGFVAEIDAVPDKKTIKFEVDTDTDGFGRLFKGIASRVSGLFDGGGGDGAGGGDETGIVRKTAIATNTFGLLAKGLVNTAQAGIGVVSGAVEAQTAAVKGVSVNAEAAFNAVKTLFNSVREQISTTAAEIAKIGGPIVQAAAAVAAAVAIPAIVTAVLGAVGLGLGPLVAAVGALVGAAIAFAAVTAVGLLAGGILPVVAVFLDKEAKDTLLASIGPLKDQLVSEFAGTTDLIVNKIAPPFIEKLGELIPLAASGAGDLIIPIADALLRLVDGFKKLFEEIMGSTVLADIGKGFALIIDTFTNALGSFLAISQEIGPPLITIVTNLLETVFALGEVFAGDIGGALQLFSDLLFLIRDPLKEMPGILTPIFELLSKIIVGVIEAGKRIFESDVAQNNTVFSNLEGQLPGLFKAVEEAGEIVISLSPLILGVIPVVKLLTAAFAGFASITLLSLDAIIGPIALVFGGITMAIGELIEWFGKAAEAFAFLLEKTGNRGAANDLRDFADSVKANGVAATETGKDIAGLGVGIYDTAIAIGKAGGAALGAGDDYKGLGEAGTIAGEQIQKTIPTFTELADGLKKGEVDADEFKASMDALNAGLDDASIQFPIAGQYIKDWGQDLFDSNARAKELVDSVKNLAVELPTATTYIKAGVAEGAEQPAVEKIGADTIDIQKAIALQAEQVAAEVQKQNTIIKLKTSGLAPLGNFIAELSPELVVSVIDQLGGFGSAAMLKANDEIAKAAAAGGNQLGNALALSATTAQNKFNQAIVLLSLETQGLGSLAGYFNALSPDEFAAQWGAYQNATEDELKFYNGLIEKGKQDEAALLNAANEAINKAAEIAKNDAIQLALDQNKGIEQATIEGEAARQKVLDDAAANADPVTAAETAAKGATDKYNAVFAENLDLAVAIENAIAATSTDKVALSVAAFARTAANYFVATFQGKTTTELALVDFGALFPTNALFTAGSAGGSSFAGGFKVAVSIGIPLILVDVAKGLVDTANWAYNVGDATGKIYVDGFKVALSLGIPLFFIDLAKALVDTATWAVDAGIAAGTSWVGGFKVSLALSIPLFFVDLGTSLVETAGWAYPAGTAAGTSWTQGFGTQVLETIPLTMTFIANNVSILGAEKLAPSGTYLGTAVMNAFALSLAANVQFIIDTLAAVGLVLALDTTWFSFAGGIMGSTVMKTLAEAIAVEVGTATAAIELVAQAILEGFQNTVGPIGSVMGTVLADSAERTALIAKFVGLAVAAALAKGFVEQIGNSATLMIGSVVTVLQAVLRLGPFWTATGKAAGTAYAVGVSLGMLDFTALAAVINSAAVIGGAASRGLLEATAEGLRGFAKTVAAVISLGIFFAGETFVNLGKSIGYAIAEGIAAGMYERLAPLKEAAIAIGRAVAVAMREALQINSPSRVMSVIGGEVVEGLIVGIQAATPQLLQTAITLGSVLPTQVDAAAASAQTTFNQTTQVDKSTTQINNWNVTTNDSMMWAQRTERLLARRRP